MSGGEGIEMQGIVSSTAINTPPPLVILSLRKSEYLLGKISES